MFTATPKLWVSVLLLTSGLCLAFASAAQANSVIIINPSDVRIVGAPGWQNTNNDPDPTGFSILSVYTMGSNVQRSLLNFDVSALNGQSIFSATLTLYANTSWGNNSGGAAMDVYKVTTAWDEHQATWNSAKTGVPWITPGGDYVGEGVGNAPFATSSANPGNNQAVIWDVTDLVAAWAGGASNLGMLLKSNEGNGLTFWSNNYSDPDLRPQLEVNYGLAGGNPVPEPFTVTMMALSGLGLVGYVRRRLA